MGKGINEPAVRLPPVRGVEAPERNEERFRAAVTREFARLRSEIAALAARVRELEEAP